MDAETSFSAERHALSASAAARARTYVVARPRSMVAVGRAVVHAQPTSRFVAACASRRAAIRTTAVAATSNAPARRYAREVFAPAPVAAPRGIRRAATHALT